MPIEYPYETPPATGGVLEISEGILWLRLPLPYALDHINVWLLRDGAAWTLVDCGLATGLVRAAWTGLFEDFLEADAIRRIIITHHHPDHIGLAHWLAQHFEVEVWITRREIEAARDVFDGVRADRLERSRAYYASHGFEGFEGLREVLDGSMYRRAISGIPGRLHLLAEGNRVSIGDEHWRVVVGRGHAPEHLCLYCERLGLLISGDHVLPTISSNISVVPWEAEADPLGDYLASFRTFREISPDTLVLPSHGLPFFGLHDRVDALQEHHERAFDKLRSLCRRPLSAYEIMPQLFRPNLEGLHLFLAMGETLAHLVNLQRRGELCVQTVDGVIRWQVLGQ